MGTIIFDNRYRGHHFEYIKHLIDYILRNELKHIIFLLHPNLVETIKKQYALDALQSIVLLPVVLENNPKHLFTLIVAETNLIQRAIKKYAVTKLIFMFFDPYQIPTGSRKFGEVEISGILFNTPLKLRANSTIKQLNVKMKKWRKINQLRFCLRHKNLNSIFLLNDTESATTLNQKLKTTIFKDIIDPIETEQIRIQERDYLTELLPKKKTTIQCLIFGSISPFKNIPNILKAVQELEETDRRKIVLNIVGPYASLENEEQMEALINYYQLNTDITIIRINRFISDLKIISSLFEHNDLILMPYINFFGSSSVLGHAARHKKLVLAPNLGVINDLVCKYKLGVTCTPNISISIKDGLINLMQQQEAFIQKAKFFEFLAGRTPAVFAKTLFLS